MGQGKGNIEFFVARVPAGRVMFKTLGSESLASFQSVTHICNWHWSVNIRQNHSLVRTFEKLISQDHWEVADSLVGVLGL